MCPDFRVRTEYPTSRELSEHLLRVAQASHDSAQRVEAHFAMGITLGFLGEFGPARVHLEQGVDCYDPQPHRALAFTYGGQDPGVACGAFAAWVLWQLGYPEQALARGQAALTLADELGYPPSLAFGQSVVAITQQFGRESRQVEERTEAIIRLCAEHSIGFWLAWGTIMRGWALGMQGRVEEGKAQIQDSLTAFQNMYTRFHRVYHLALQGELCGKRGQSQEALALLAEAQAEMNDTGERYYEAELYRLKGELLLNDERRMLDDERRRHEAEACFQQAIDVACRQEAKSWELRASVSLARLWQEQGKTTEAHDLLAPVYSWFTEGFDTADLKDAKSLLDALP